MSLFSRKNSTFSGFFARLLAYTTDKVMSSPSLWPHIPLETHTSVDTERKKKARGTFPAPGSVVSTGALSL
jgi:hypothetical protein